ncbi:MAG: hypothetical protein H7Y22_04940 [Gemmatimonadaceae bacterium]|nr:hypothetical protein [Gloeobacterales cyanobacterium ES-bin-141]
MQLLYLALGATNALLKRGKSLVPINLVLIKGTENAFFECDELIAPMQFGADECGLSYYSRRTVARYLLMI